MQSVINDRHFRVGDAKRFYNSTAWQRARRRQLRRHPICESCFDRRATQVDHATPLSQGGHPLDSSNLQSLCASCHSRKTAERDGGFGNSNGRVKGCATNGMPLDPSHPWFRNEGDEL